MIPWRPFREHARDGRFAMIISSMYFALQMLLQCERFELLELSSQHSFSWEIQRFSSCVKQREEFILSSSLLAWAILESHDFMWLLDHTFHHALCMFEHCAHRCSLRMTSLSLREVRSLSVESLWMQEWMHRRPELRQQSWIIPGLRSLEDHWYDIQRGDTRLRESRELLQHNLQMWGERIFSYVEKWRIRILSMREGVWQYIFGLTAPRFAMMRSLKTCYILPVTPPLFEGLTTFRNRWVSEHDMLSGFRT